MAQESLYKQVINHYLKSQFTEIIELSDQIAQCQDNSARNDLLLTLSYAYLNIHNLEEFNNTLKLINHPSPKQEGVTHELLGILYLIKQEPSKAKFHFKIAVDHFDQPHKDLSYYEATNNLAYTHILLTDNEDFTNILLDQVIEHCSYSQDSALMSRALLCKAISYPINADYLLQRAYNIGPPSLKSTISFLKAKQSKNEQLMKYALELNSQTDNSYPTPLKINERAEIVLALSNLSSDDIPTTMYLLRKQLRDSAFLTEAYKNQLLFALSRSEETIGRHDSAAYYLFKTTNRYSENHQDTIRQKIPELLYKISRQSHQKQFYLTMTIATFILTLLLASFLIATHKKSHA